MDPTRKDAGIHSAPQVELKIILDQRTGQIKVFGPIENKILALGMIEMGKAAVMAYVPGTGIQIPQGPRLIEPV